MEKDIYIEKSVTENLEGNSACEEQRLKVSEKIITSLQKATWWMRYSMIITILNLIPAVITNWVQYERGMLTKDVLIINIVYFSSIIIIIGTPFLYHCQKMSKALREKDQASFENVTKTYKNFLAVSTAFFLITIVLCLFGMLISSSYINSLI